MSIQYLSVIIIKIPTLLNLLSLQDVCHLRETCREMRDIIDNRMIVKRSNNNIEVSCANNHYRKITITESREYAYCDVHPLNDNIFGWTSDEVYSKSMTTATATIIENNDKKTIRIYTESKHHSRDNLRIEKVSDNHYRRIDIPIGVHYLKIDNQCIKVIDGTANSTNEHRFGIHSDDRHVVYDINNHIIITGSIEQDDNDPFWVALNIVKSIL